MTVETKEITLPGNQILAKGEELIKKEQFMSSLLTFYIKSDFAITNKRFIAHYPNIVLGIIPMGFKNITLPTNQISGVNINVEYKIFYLLLGIISLFLTLAGFTNGAGSGIFFLILTLAFFSSGIRTYIEVSSSGTVTKCPIVFFEKGKATKLVNELNNSIAGI